ncbi:MAG: glycerophosphodiester phosphodiesterase family protein [Coriobacteriales bacterium]|jgi:glycerophosphoryl diester phosphodiesterase
MIVLLIVIAVIVVLAVLGLLAIRPCTGRRERLAPFAAQPIAHRGLHGDGVPENSLAAFARAAEEGYGIELDVRRTADNRLVVMHDKTLERMCGDPRAVCEVRYDELAELRLHGTDERIPLLSEVLAVVDGAAVPLVVEVKTDRWFSRTPALVDEMMRAYADPSGGAYCIESFNPMALRWFKRHSPQTIRGQISDNFLKVKAGGPWIGRFAMTNMVLNFLARPDFIAYNLAYRRQVAYRTCRRLYKAAGAAWVVRSPAQLETVRDAFDIFIFEGFRP